MNALRPPVIAGLVPGSGTSTLAAALHASDAGVLGHRVAGEADVVVCPAGELRYAAALACSPSGPRPVLAVVLDPAEPEDIAPRLAAVAARFGAVATLPHVPRWHGHADVRNEAASVLGRNAEHLARPLRAYVATLRTIVAVLSESGVLRRTAPPLVSRPSTGGLWPGLRTAEQVDPPQLVPPQLVPAQLVPAQSAPAFEPAPAGPAKIRLVVPSPTLSLVEPRLPPEAPAELAPVHLAPVRAEVEAPGDDALGDDALDDEAIEALLFTPPFPAGRAG